MSSMNKIKKIAIPIIKKFLAEKDLVHIFDNKSSSEIQVEGFLDILNEAEKSLDIVSPFIDSLFARLIKTLSYRIKIRLLTNPQYSEKMMWMSDTSDIEVHCMPQKSAILHSKFIIMDEEAIIYGSTNLTEFSWDRNYEHVIASDETNMVHRYQSYFCNMWKESVPVKNLKSQTKMLV